jgi:hypothetical protein
VRKLHLLQLPANACMVLGGPNICQSPLVTQNEQAVSAEPVVVMACTYFYSYLLFSIGNAVFH